MKSIKFPYIIAACAIILTASVPASAKVKEPEPDGIQVGSFVLHPGANLALAYDSKSSESPSDGLIDIGILFNTRLTENKTKTWNNEIALKWRQYWGVGDANANGDINATISTSADLFKLSTFRFTPSASYRYIGDAEDENLRQNFKNHFIRAAAVFNIQPGEGAIFSEKLSYAFTGQLYPDHSDISNFEHRIESVTRWSFLPHSSMSLTVNVTIAHFLENQRNASEGEDVSDTTQNLTSYPVRIKYSLQGLLLARLSYELGLGYAFVYYSKEIQEHMFIMHARLAYSFRTNLNLAIDYKKDFDNAIFGNYMKLHRVALVFDALWFDKLQTEASVGAGFFDFKTDKQLRSDILVTARVGIAYHILPGLKLGVDYKFNLNLSDYDAADYTKHMAMLNLSYQY